MVAQRLSFSDHERLRLSTKYLGKSAKYRCWYVQTEVVKTSQIVPFLTTFQIIHLLESFSNDFSYNFMQQLTRIRFN